MSAPRLLAPAERELRAALCWSESMRPGLGAEFLGAVHGVVGRTAENPGAGPLLDGQFTVPAGGAPRFPCVLFFHIVGDEPVVVAVAHSSRRPGYWLDRTPKNQEGPPNLAILTGLHSMVGMAECLSNFLPEPPGVVQ